MSSQIGGRELSIPDDQTASAGSPIRTRAVSACAVCGGAGEIAYSGLRDRLFGVKRDQRRNAANVSLTLLSRERMVLRDEGRRLPALASSSISSDASEKFSTPPALDRRML